MGRTILLIVAWIMLLGGLAGICYASVEQMILCYEKFGVIIDSAHLIIPHISLLGYIGVIPFITGSVIIRLNLVRGGERC